ncbi:hypothetical protein GCM10010251_97050 [Streptomyces aurantiogriseus]|uniref:Uncharacterized protein n=1 Tax=Streptomyces aurantiogriseus TaxID=66870 RepID=A0A918FPK8_9ACTN|nr:hypothetical protein GCM10010251_97050 [Streptomyces aurantiogriseus]
MKPGKRALHDPAHFAKSGAVSNAASGDHRLDAALPQLAAVLVEVVVPVGVQSPGPTAGPPSQAPDRWDRVQQRQKLGDVVSVAAGERGGQRGAVAVDDQVVL